MIYQSPVYISAIQTMVPDYSYTQRFARDQMLELSASSTAEKNFIRRVYDHSGIETRYSVLPDFTPSNGSRLFPAESDYRPEPDSVARNNVFIEEAEKLSQKTVTALFAKHKEMNLSEITHLITVSCTGFSAPGFDIALQKHFNLSPGVERVHIGFMGCYAAFPALRTAAQILQTDAKAKVLVVALELCSLHLKLDFERERQVANALFADGCAALVLQGQKPESSAFRLNSTNSQLLQKSEEDMAWNLGALGFDMRLSAYVPKILDENIEAAIEETLGNAGVGKEEVKAFAFHPGGKAILDKLKSRLKLKDEQLSPSYKVLQDYGNMSSPTVLFVLQQWLNRLKQGDKVYSAAFGPGLTIESAFLESV